MKRICVTFGLFLLNLAVSGFAGEVDEATRKQVQGEIKSYVDRDTDVKGRFLILDPRSDEPLALTFDHVHEGVHPHDRGYVACVDFKDRTGKVYDVDFVIGKASGSDSFAVREVHLHKVDGKAVGSAEKKNP